MGKSVFTRNGFVPSQIYASLTDPTADPITLLPPLEGEAPRCFIQPPKPDYSAKSFQDQIPALLSDQEVYTLCAEMKKSKISEAIDCRRSRRSKFKSKRSTDSDSSRSRKRRSECSRSPTRASRRSRRSPTRAYRRRSPTRDSRRSRRDRNRSRSRKPTEVDMQESQPQQPRSQFDIFVESNKKDLLMSGKSFTIPHGVQHPAIASGSDSF